MADPKQLLTRAADLHARGMAANEQMRPGVAARQLYAALDLLDPLLNPDGIVSLGGTVGPDDIVGPDGTTGVDGTVSDQEQEREARTLRGRVRISLAWAESERGNVTTGLQLLADAEHDLPPTEVGLVHGQRGILLRRTGRDAEAALAYGRALASFDPETQPDQLARVRLNRSMMHLAAVNLTAARTDLDVCLELAERHELPQLSAKARHNLGLLDFVAGDLPGALAAFRAAESAYGPQAVGMIGQLGLDRARALVAAGLLTEAESELRLAIRRLVGQQLEQDLAEAHLALAEVALLAGRPAGIRTHTRRAAQIFQRRRNDRWLARARLLELRGALAAGRPIPDPAEFEALETSCAAVGLVEDGRVAGILSARARTRSGVSTMPEARLRPRTGDRLDTRLLWALARAEAQFAAGHGSAARRSLAQGLAALDVQRSRMGAIDLRSGAAAHGRALTRLELESAVREGRPSTIFHWSELSRAQALLLPAVRPPADPALAAALAELRGLDASIAERQDLRQGSAAGVSRVARMARGSAPAHGLIEMRRRREVLRRQIREHHWSVGTIDQMRREAGLRGTVRLGQVREALGDMAMVCYLDLDGRLAALVVTSRRAVVVPLGPLADLVEPLQRIRVDLDVAATHRLPAPIAAAVKSSTDHLGRVLSAGLIDPLLPLVGDAELVVVPTGSLFVVPWAALPPLNGRAVTVALSASTWLMGRGRLAELRTLAGGSGSCGGAGNAHDGASTSEPGDTQGSVDANRPADASGSAGAGTVFAACGPRIGYGEREIADIAGRFPGSRTLTGTDATVEQVLAELGRAGVAHLAAHGHHAEENALFSGLEYADGAVMGYDVQSQPTVPALVVLSACDVGRSAVAPGDESLGMVSALAAAGAGTVVAAVSRIADERAPLVMQAFYDGLQAGHSPARALADAGSREGVTGLVCFGSG